MDKFETALRVRNWIWRAYPPQEGKRVKSLLAEDIRKSYLEGWGQTEGSGCQMLCGEVAILFKEGLELVGLKARHIEIGNKDNPIAHFGVEVWTGLSWVMMEAMRSPSLPAYCLHKLTPMNAWQLHEALLAGNPEAVGLVHLGEEGCPPMDYLKNFYYVRVLDGSLSGYYKDEENPFDRWNCTIEPREHKSTDPRPPTWAGLSGRGMKPAELWWPPRADLTKAPVRDISRKECWDSP